ncbi:MAG: hypothetical protein KAS62_06215, partial [Candidatus Delongbacteria bacterium]|nr:hypothetical protein [Candidatus Delongbacteria bacterium]
YDDYQSQVYTNAYGYEINMSIFSTFYKDNHLCEDSTAYFCDFGKKQESKLYDPKSQKIDENYKKENTTNFIEVIQSTISSQSDKNTKDLVAYPAFTSRYPNSLDLWPGTYTVFMQAIRKDLYLADGTISEIARHDSMQFIIPQWKMKFFKDYWFEEKVPYTEIKEYQKTKTMKLTFWRPWYMAPYNPLYLDVIRETDSTIVQNYEIDFNTKASFDDVGWDIPEATVPGFYNIKANNVDYYTDIEVTQEVLTQVCPLYLSWENEGAWPDNWPGGETTTDWEIYTSPPTPTLGEYSLAAKYNTDVPGQAILERENLSIEGEWDRLLEFAIGLPKSV